MSPSSHFSRASCNSFLSRNACCYFTLNVVVKLIVSGLLFQKLDKTRFNKNCELKSKFALGFPLIIVQFIKVCIFFCYILNPWVKYLCTNWLFVTCFCNAFLCNTLYSIINSCYHFKLVSSDRTSYSDDVLVYIQLGSNPLFEILRMHAFL